MSQQLLGGIIAAIALAVVSGWGEYRRRNRRDFDRVGIVPWQFLQLLALFALAILIGTHFGLI